MACVALRMPQMQETSEAEQSPVRYDAQAALAGLFDRPVSIRLMDFAADGEVGIRIRLLANDGTPIREVSQVVDVESLDSALKTIPQMLLELANE